MHYDVCKEVKKYSDPPQKKVQSKGKKYCLTLMKDDPLPDWNVQKHSHSLSLCCFFP